MSRTPVDWKTLTAELEEQGFRVTRTEGNHWKAVPPTAVGNVVHFSQSSDWRAFHNTVSQLRKAGLEYPKERPMAERKIAPAATGSQTLKAPLAAIAPAPALKVEDEADRLFRELKQAREYLRLAEEELEAKHEKLIVADEEHRKAAEAKREASEALKVARTAFHRAFDEAE